MYALYGSNLAALTVNWAMAISVLQLRDLGDRDDDELRRLQRREADDDVHPPEVDLGLRVDGLVADDEERVGLRALRALLEGALAKQAAHEAPDGEAQL